jgi:bifunctional UDP-N-acetylglucosamine pyrophosphorylase/glucosamine-1-phosphate N-acetyltransferase
MQVDVVIMAAGKGTRMKSAKPKVLHELAGRALLGHVLSAVAPLQPRQVVVVTGFQAEQVAAYAAACMPMAQCVKQEPQLGTGHAVQQAAPLLGDDGVTLVLNGDEPQVDTATLAALARAGQEGLALLSLDLAGQPQAALGLGRVVRDARDAVLSIVEEKDATPEQRALTEAYTGTLAAPTALLKRWLGLLRDDNAQREFYLTDVVKHAVAEGAQVQGVRWQTDAVSLGINDPLQLAAMERRWQRRTADALMRQGVRLSDPGRIDVRGQLTCEPDVEIDVNCVFAGEVRLGVGVRVGANCVIRNAHLSDGVVVDAFTHIDGGDGVVQVGAQARVGPFARLRPGTSLGAEVHIGNFVEVKNSSLAAGAKANHLAYLGDATVGERVNYGAGSITANYDGAHKHRTIIEADAHIGSNCVLVAPVTVGAGATIGGGSTIAKDAPAGQLTVARGKQVSLPAWKRPQKK